MKLYRNAIILVVIVAILVGAYFVVSKNRPEVDLAESNTDTIRLTDYTTDKIESLTLVNPEGTFVIVKKDNEWVLSSPADLKYDSTKLSSIVINAASIIADKLVEENAKDLSLYGLEDTITVRLKDTEGKEKVLEIGDKTPTKSGYYVKPAENNNVYVISSYTGDYFVSGRNSMRSKKLFDFTSDVFTRFAMERNGESLFSSEKESSSSLNWSMVKPIKGSMNPSALTPMLDALSNSMVVEFVEDKPEDLAKYGLDNPKYVFDFGTSTAGGFRLKLGDEKVKDSEVYAQLEGSDEVFTMDTSAYTFLDKPLKEIIEVFAYIVNIDQVQKIDLTMDGKTTHMTIDTYKDAEGKSDKDKDKFTVNGIDASGKNEDDDQPFRTFYQALIGISLDEIQEDGKPEGSAEITINYTLKDGSMKVEYIPKDENYYYVVRNGEYAGILCKRNKKEYGVEGMKEAYREIMDFLAIKQ